MVQKHLYDVSELGTLDSIAIGAPWYAEVGIHVNVRSSTPIA